MPKRIFIKDGGLTSSIPTPAGYTVLGSDNGVPKKQVQSTISDIGASGGGETHLIAKTYAELLALSGSSSLIQGQHYLLTDFQTRSIIPNTTEFTVGDIEPLILLAINNNQFSQEVISTIYPQDIVRYGFDKNINGGTKGTILYRKDTQKDLATHYDWRVVKFRRWSNPIMGEFDILTNNGEVFNDYYTFRVDDFPMEVRKTEIPLFYDIDLNPILNNIVFQYTCANNTFENGAYLNSTFINETINNNINCGSFTNNSFYQFTSNRINASSFQNISRSGTDAQFTNNVIDCTNFSDNNPYLFTGNIIQSRAFTGNTFSGERFFNNNSIFAVVFSENTLSIMNANNVYANDFSQNSLSDFNHNNITCDIFFDNNIGSGFYQNSINFPSLLFRNNQIGNFFAYNIINASVLNCTNINDFFQYNTINVELSGLNLSTPTNFYNTIYTKTVVRNAGGNTLLTYLNGSNTPVYVAVP